MRAIRRRFNRISNDNQGWSSFICFEETVRGQGFTHDAIRRWFNKLVGRDDYDRHDKIILVRGIYELAEK